MTFADAVEALYALGTGVIGKGADRHERPHKPVLLLAVFDALAAGRARPDHVTWSNWLRERFRVYFDLVGSHNDECTPENPFFYLKNDGFWAPVAVTPEGELPLATTPLARDLDTDRVFARFGSGWEILVGLPDSRMGFRNALVSRYFPHARSELGAHFIEPSAIPGSDNTAGPGDESGDTAPGRSAAFRRRVVEIYDYQCVACGLRIWMPEQALTFVDAAHLVPFSETRNDHPTNGLALCKNHHWALDQRLIAPDPDAVWRVSRLVDVRRSRGEEELARLAGQPLLSPAESAFAPERSNLEWRFARLLS
jgi:putative restriction endonuclease